MNHRGIRVALLFITACVVSGAVHNTSRADKKEYRVLFLLVNEKGELEVPGEEPLITVAQIRQYLSAQSADAIAIRAHETTLFKDVYKLWRLCREAGFRDVQCTPPIKANP